MDKMLEAAVQQVPALVVLVFIVYQFLKHLRQERLLSQSMMAEQRKDWMAALKDRDERLVIIAQDCHKSQGASLSVMRDNIKTLNRVEVKLAELG